MFRLSAGRAFNRLELEEKPRGANGLALLVTVP